MPVETISKLLSPFDLGGFGVFVIAAGLIFIGYRFINSTSENTLKERFGIQIVGLTLLVPIILIVAVVMKLESEAVTTLLGTIVGYFFGAGVKAQDTPPKDVA